MTKRAFIIAMFQLAAKFEKEQGNFNLVNILDDTERLYDEQFKNEPQKQQNRVITGKYEFKRRVFIFKGWNRLFKVMTMPFGIEDIGKHGVILNQRVKGLELMVSDCELLLYDEYSQLTQGDIIEKVYERFYDGDTVHEKKDIGVVVFEKGAFGVKWNMYSKDIEFFCHRYYLGEAPFYNKIGTIFENPELTKKLKKGSRKL